MNHIRLKVCIITFLALLFSLTPRLSNAQENKKDTIDTFLFDFLLAQQTIRPAYLTGIIQKATTALSHKNTTIDTQIKLLIISSDAHLKLKETAKSSDAIEKAEHLANKQNNKKLQALIALEKGNLYRVLSEKEKAKESFQKSIATARSAGDEFIEAESYIQLGNMSRMEGNFKQALTAYDQAIVIYRKKKSTELLIEGLGLRASTHRDLSNKQEGLKDVNEAIAIATKNGSHSIANIINIKGSIHYRFGEVDLALQNYRNAQSHVHKQPLEVELQATLQENIALCLKDKLQYSEAKATLDSAFAARVQRPDTIALAKNYSQQGNLSLQLGEYANALENYLIALELRQMAGTSNDIAASQTNIGLLYRTLGLNDKAVDYFKDALSQRSENGTNAEMGDAYTHLGNAYFDSKRFNESLDCYKKALNCREKTKDKSLEARSLNSIATAYQEIGNYSKAESYYRDALETTEVSDIKGRAIIHNNLGNFYLGRGNEKKALLNFYSALHLHESAQNILGQGLSLRKIGEIYLNRKEYNKADSCLAAGLHVGQKSGNLEHLKNTNFALYRLYSAKKDYEKALNFYIAFAEIQDSIAKTKSSEELINARLSVEMEKKKSDITRIENEITVLRKEAQLQESESKRQTYILIFLISSSILLVVLGGVLYRAYRLKKQKASLLQEKYTITKEANEQLAKSEENLKKLNATKDKFFSIIAHDLKSPFNALLGFSELLKSRAKTLSPKEVYEYSDTIHGSSEKLYALLENLLQWARTQTGKIQFNPIDFNINETLSKNISIQELTAKNKNITIEVETIEDFKVKADLDMVNTILRNLLSNAVKFTPSGGSITVSTAAQNNHVAVSITDTGGGMTEEELSLLFRLDVHFTTKGTGNETGTGLGLIICKEFVERNLGEIAVSSQVGIGSTFTFTLPIKQL